MSKKIYSITNGAVAYSDFQLNVIISTIEKNALQGIRSTGGHIGTLTPLVILISAIFLISKKLFVLQKLSISRSCM